MTYQGMETKIGPAAIDQEQASVDYSVIDGVIGKVFPGEFEHPWIAEGLGRALRRFQQSRSVSVAIPI